LPADVQRLEDCAVFVRSWKQKRPNKSILATTQTHSHTQTMDTRMAEFLSPTQLATILNPNSLFSWAVNFWVKLKAHK
jgi:hypothetical protein